MEHTLSDDTIHGIKYSNITIPLLQLATTVIYLHLVYRNLNTSIDLNIFMNLNISVNLNIYMNLNISTEYEFEYSYEFELI